MNRPVSGCIKLQDLMSVLQAFIDMGDGNACVMNEDGCPLKHSTIVNGSNIKELVLSFEDGK